MRPRRRTRSAPVPAPDDGSLKLLQDRLEREAHARDRADRFREEMEEATRVLRGWATGAARAHASRWNDYEATTRLIAVELGREAAAAARTLLRSGRTLTQAIAHGIAVAEELIPGVHERLGLRADGAEPAAAISAAEVSDRRRRIQRLRAKAAATPFFEEAASFTAKADQLAAKYGIDS